jgi:REP-associated tyrosine transposase
MSASRRKRFAPAGCFHHVVNRGNDRQTIFHDSADYRRFIELLTEGCLRFQVELGGHCEINNHFHLLALPASDEALSEYMQWVLCRYACDLRRRTRTVGHGHIFQRRFWSTPILDAVHCLTVLRYIEANPVAAGLVHRAENWPWSSLAARENGDSTLSRLPFSLPEDWRDIVNIPLGSEVQQRICGALMARPGRPRAK